MITITLDTSCFDTECEGEINEIIQLYKEGKIEVYVPLEVQMEIYEYKGDRKKKLKYLGWAMTFNNEDWYASEDKDVEDILPSDEKEYKEVMKKIRQIHSQELTNLKSVKKSNIKPEKLLNKYNDWVIIFKAIDKGCDYFAVWHDCKFFANFVTIYKYN